MENAQQDATSLVLRLIAEHADARKVMKAIRAMEFTHAPSKDIWLESTSAVALLADSELEWLERSQRAWVWDSVRDFLVDSLTTSQTKDSPSQGETEAALLPFLNWLKSQPDQTVVDFCWDVLAFRPRPYGSYVTCPVHWLRRTERLAGEISYKDIECAIALADEAEAMYWWPDERWRPVRWERDSQGYTDFISKSGYLIRAAAAKALGELFWGCSRKVHVATGPVLSEVMGWIQIQEQIRPGVAGAFLGGSHWSFGELRELAPSYDFRTWLLETLRTSFPEPHLPHTVSMEFYAHEYFCGDAQAIEEMLHMGRFKLAVMTATEEPSFIESLQEVLNAMANSDHPGVAGAIRQYLIEREHHAGLELMAES